jgi:hypothetical protein
MSCLIPYSWPLCSAGKAWRVGCSMAAPNSCRGLTNQLGHCFQLRALCCDQVLVPKLALRCPDSLLIRRSFRDSVCRISETWPLQCGKTVHGFYVWYPFTALRYGLYLLISLLLCLYYLRLASFLLDRPPSLLGRSPSFLARPSPPLAAVLASSFPTTATKRSKSPMIISHMGSNLTMHYFVSPTIRSN